MLVLALKVVSAQSCGGAATQGPVRQGEGVTLIAPSGVTAGTLTWTITNPIYPSIDSDPFQSAFSNPSGCNVDFNAVRAGTFTIEVTDGTSTGTISIEVEDVLETYGFGHQCYVIDTGNCGDLYTYGDIIALEAISANDIFSYGIVHSYGTITVGGTVSLAPTLVQLPDTLITGDLDVSGNILDSSDNVVDISSNVHMTNNLSVDGVTTLSDLLVQAQLTALAGASILGNLVVTGDANVDTLSVSQDADVTGSVKSEGRFMGNLNLRKTCDAASPRMYQENDDFVIELGQAGQCTGMEPCESDEDCNSYQLFPSIGGCRADKNTCLGEGGDPCQEDADCMGPFFCDAGQCTV